MTDWDTSNVELYEDFLDKGDRINRQPCENLFK